jgi:hypothetical protein
MEGLQTKVGGKLRSQILFKKGKERFFCPGGVFAIALTQLLRLPVAKPRRSSL